jgi:prepilin-type N-terminal cleavage/methylation domain-containing protein
MRRLPERLRGESGMTLIEVLVAMAILTIGIVSLLSAFEGARKLTLVAERRASIAHLAQRELERLQSVPYSELAMVSAPSRSSEETNPDYYVNYAGAGKCKEVEGWGCYSWNAENPAEEEALVATISHEKCPTTGTTTKECGVISPSPTGVSCSEVNPFGACEWTDGRLSGAVYDFVTYHEDKTGCKTESCPTSYKRVTVVVTVNVPKGDHKVTPVRVSTLIPDPKAAKESPLTSPSTQCDEKSCIEGIDKGTARSWFLHDLETAAVEKTSFAEAQKKAEEVKSHTTHLTVGPVGAESAKPDIMDSNGATRSTLYDYSTDQDTKGFTYGTLKYGGRRIAKDVGCSTEAELESKPPSTTQYNGELWTTSPLSSKIKLNGAGGLTLYTQTIGGEKVASITLCLGVYDVPESIEKLWTSAETTPKLIAFYSYTSTSWPTAMSSLAFVFSLKFVKGAQEIEAKHRLGFRIWPSNEAIAVAYDTLAQPSILQLNTE